MPLPDDPRIREALFNKYFPCEDWERAFHLCTSEIKRIGIYTGLSFKEVQELSLSLFLLYRKESWVYSFNRTEEGKEFLKTLWRLQQTKADTKAIREFTARR
ncbi:hypothetical protein JW813_11220 [Clostridium botulinum]|uniref:hypothetical protein n=1 Tax=Clostridium botulinum TaxID=1491 RepID=UPI002245DF4E|nr:hypothetical protein [Clostridium botulinum]UZP02290.1 hypothetical protein JW813_11220 [Clostridium botulinum]UZP05649.1 hypothetical protein JYA71_11490 [Clostridium botulinum]UZP09029.1 hypothetical protein JYA74_11215 [Clostridium botulinum]